ncbi:RING-type zinc-finger domain-containing protein [Giardia muris]|uniref:RING-type zinc-finger domain-containing protein n=1 Tax=Giardia muris TaxID=5742 RepID=A0A4Z1SV54_GIAMU|nr:RING-type zinc-finger domain-containing protein [Giardia muris]|eukprot:TNJ28815.1 RING-type zinc-finger domain-containing protein [Giardia muris]
MELLACPACKQTFSAPITLKCGHTFCRGCLDRGRRRKRCQICSFAYRITPNINICLHHIVELALPLGQKYTFDSEAMSFELRTDESYTLPTIERRVRRPRSVQRIIISAEPEVEQADTQTVPQVVQTIPVYTAEPASLSPPERPLTPRRSSIASEIIHSYEQGSQLLSKAPRTPVSSVGSGGVRRKTPRSARLKQRRRDSVVISAGINPTPQNVDEICDPSDNDPIRLMNTMPLKPARRVTTRTNWESVFPTLPPTSISTSTSIVSLSTTLGKSVGWSASVKDNSPQATLLPKDVGLPVGGLRDEIRDDEFHINDKVRVTSAGSDFGQFWVGQIGTVCAIAGDAVTIKFATATWTCSARDVERVTDVRAAPKRRLQVG